MLFSLQKLIWYAVVPPCSLILLMILCPVAMFAKRGFTVIPAPTYQNVQSRKYGIFMLIPSSGALERSSRAIAEWMGMAWWKLRGEI